MPDPQWFYAQGDQQKGPVSEQQLRSMLSSGSLKPADLVWNERMPDWAPAGKVPELASTAAASPRGGPPETPPSRSSTSPRFRMPKLSLGNWNPGAIEPLKYGRVIGQPLLLAGLVLVILAKGCDSVGSRSADRLRAKEQAAKAEFEDQWSDKATALVDEQQKLEADIGDRSPSEADDAKFADIKKRRDKLAQDKAKEEQKLQRGDWRDLERAARDAQLSNRMWGYWREMFFVFGSILLTIGLLAVGFTAEGAARWISLIMLAIITFSLFVGGLAWLGAIRPNIPSP